MCRRACSSRPWPRRNHRGTAAECWHLQYVRDRPSHAWPGSRACFMVDCLPIMLAGASSGMEILSYLEVGLVSCLFGTSLEQKSVSGYRATQVRSCLTQADPMCLWVNIPGHPDWPVVMPFRFLRFILASEKNLYYHLENKNHDRAEQLIPKDNGKINCHGNWGIFLLPGVRLQFLPPSLEGCLPVMGMLIDFTGSIKWRELHNTETHVELSALSPFLAADSGKLSVVCLHLQGCFHHYTFPLWDGPSPSFLLISYALFLLRHVS